MLTRLKVDGFKNLVGADVRFGPFTCIAGANGVGKSNLFDAICFLSALSEKTLMEAALSVRDKEYGSKQTSSPLEIRREELVHITLGEAKQHLLFPINWSGESRLYRAVGQAPSYPQKEKGRAGSLSYIKIKGAADRSLDLL